MMPIKQNVWVDSCFSLHKACFSLVTFIMLNLDNISIRYAMNQKSAIQISLTTLILELNTVILNFIFSLNIVVGLLNGSNSTKCNQALTRIAACHRTFDGNFFAIDRNFVVSKAASTSIVDGPLFSFSAW